LRKRQPEKKRRRETKNTRVAGEEKTISEEREKPGKGGRSVTGEHVLSAKRINCTGAV